MKMNSEIVFVKEAEAKGEHVNPNGLKLNKTASIFIIVLGRRR